jgi:hypothetical protein
MRQHDSSSDGWLCIASVTGMELVIVYLIPADVKGYIDQLLSFRI